VHDIYLNPYCRSRQLDPRAGEEPTCQALCLWPNCRKPAVQAATGVTAVYNDIIDRGSHERCYWNWRTRGNEKELF